MPKGKPGRWFYRNRRPVLDGPGLKYPSARRQRQLEAMFPSAIRARDWPLTKAPPIAAEITDSVLEELKEFGPLGKLKADRLKAWRDFCRWRRREWMDRVQTIRGRELPKRTNSRKAPLCASWMIVSRMEPGQALLYGEIQAMMVDLYRPGTIRYFVWYPLLARGILERVGRPSRLGVDPPGYLGARYRLTALGERFRRFILRALARIALGEESPRDYGGRFNGGYQQNDYRARKRRARRELDAVRLGNAGDQQRH